MKEKLKEKLKSRKVWAMVAVGVAAALAKAFEVPISDEALEFLGWLLEGGL